MLEVLYEDVPLTVQECYALLSASKEASGGGVDCVSRLQSPLLVSPHDSFLVYSHVKRQWGRSGLCGPRRC